MAENGNKRVFDTEKQTSAKFFHEKNTGPVEFSGALANIRERQATEFGTNEPKFFSNGNPRMKKFVKVVLTEGTVMDSNGDDHGPGDVVQFALNCWGHLIKAWNEAKAEYAAGIGPGVIVDVDYQGKVEQDFGEKFGRREAHTYAYAFRAPKTKAEKEAAQRAVEMFDDEQESAAEPVAPERPQSKPLSKEQLQAALGEHGIGIK